MGIGDRLNRLERDNPYLPCEERNCQRVAWAERLLLLDGREELVGQPPPTLCDTCPVHEREVPSVLYVEVRRDYRGYDDEAAAPEVARQPQPEEQQAVIPAAEAEVEE